MSLTEKISIEDFRKAEAYIKATGVPVPQYDSILKGLIGSFDYYLSKALEDSMQPIRKGKALGTALAAYVLHERLHRENEYAYFALGEVRKELEDLISIINDDNRQKELKKLHATIANKVIVELRKLEQQYGKLRVGCSQSALREYIGNALRQITIHHEGNYYELFAKPFFKDGKGKHFILARPVFQNGSREDDLIIFRRKNPY